MRVNVHDLVAEAATVHADRPALTLRRRSVDYATLWALTRAAGSGLRDLGVGPGDRVAVLLDKRIETVTALFGASVAGAVFVPVNPVLKPRQVGHLLQDSGAVLLVTTAARLALLGEELKGCPQLRHVVLVGDPVAAGTEHGDLGLHAWSEVCTRRGSDQLGPPRLDTDVAAILYTSGSTGRPKGVVLSHRNLIAGAESVAGYLDHTAADVILAALPLSFDAGLSQLTTAFSAGAHVVLTNYLLPGDLVRLCAEHQVTGLTCVPPLWAQIADQDWPADARGLRYFANTGGRMPRVLLDRLRAVFPGARPFLMYGLTEAFRSTYLPPEEVDRRPDSIGKAIPNAEILVVRPDGSLCEDGEEGELVHRGATVALGYWNDPERSAERFRPAPMSADGWRLPEIAVWSGDRAVRDADGYLYFVGRRDEMIKTSGYRVSPTEIEEVAYDTGLVRDAVAFGVPDERLGQRVILVVAAHRDEGFDAAELHARLRAMLPLFMVPAEIHRVRAIPRSPNGKFDRVRLAMEVAG